MDSRFPVMQSGHSRSTRRTVIICGKNQWTLRLTAYWTMDASNSTQQVLPHPMMNTKRRRCDASLQLNMTCVEKAGLLREVTFWTSRQTSRSIPRK